MTTTSKFVCVVTGCFILCIGLSSGYAAHPQAETDMSNDRGSQGNQEMIKGNSTPKKSGQDEKVDQTKLKEDKKSAKQEFDKNNSKGQEKMSDESTVPLRKLQNN